VGVPIPLIGVISVEAPVTLTRFAMNAVVSKAAVMDVGIRWLFDTLGKALESDCSDKSAAKFKEKQGRKN
jgi:hypothetical protein